MHDSLKKFFAVAGTAVLLAACTTTEQAPTDTDVLEDEWMMEEWLIEEEQEEEEAPVELNIDAGAAVEVDLNGDEDNGEDVEGDQY